MLVLPQGVLSFFTVGDIVGNTVAGQMIGALREGSFESVVGAVTSPPYEASVNTQDKGGIDWAKAGRPDRLVQSDDRHGVQGDMPMAYGVSDGQIGAESGGTYWQAMRQVYGELYKVLRPGGVAAIVMKDFIRNKQRVPLCDMTAQPLEAIGFTVVERTHAMLMKEEHVGIDMFSGAHVTKRTERKSFFKRLAEKNGAPAIDYEEVIWAVKR